MPYQISWYTPQRVIKLTVTGKFTFEELQQVAENIRLYIAQGASPIHLIADLSQMESVPTQVSDLNKTIGSLRSLSSSIIIGKMNPILRFCALVLAKLNGGYDLQIVDNMDEALIVLSRLDPELSQSITMT